ncbi:MAG: hypothetical protein ACK4HQ_02960 [Brevinematales bacterium]
MAGYAGKEENSGTGTVWISSGNKHGQLETGDKNDKTTFIQVFSDAKAIAAGGFHTLVLKNDGTVWATGNNGSGQLGTGDTNNRLTFVFVHIP